MLFIGCEFYASRTRDESHAISTRTHTLHVYTWRIDPITTRWWAHTASRPYCASSSPWAATAAASSAQCHTHAVTVTERTRRASLHALARHHYYVVRWGASATGSRPLLAAGGRCRCGCQSRIERSDTVPGCRRRRRCRHESATAFSHHGRRLLRQILLRTLHGGVHRGRREKSTRSKY